jgi:hypothetical protein
MRVGLRLGGKYGKGGFHGFTHLGKALAYIPP